MQFCSIIRSDVVFAEVVFYYALTFLAVIVMNDKQHKTEKNLTKLLSDL